MPVNTSEIGAFINAQVEDDTPDLESDFLLSYDTSASGIKKVLMNKVGSGESGGGLGADGWAAADAMTYSSADAPTYTVTCTGDQTAKYNPGMRLKLTDSTVKYFIITSVSYSSPNTIITLYGGTDYSLSGGSISSPYYSSAKAPAGFPLDPAKWMQTTSYSSLADQANPTNGSWYNVGSVSLSIPIGIWRVLYKCMVDERRDSNGNVDVFVTLSTANNSASDGDFTTFASEASTTDVYASLTAEKYLNLTSKTTYYLDLMTDIADQTHIYLRGDITKIIVMAICAYL